MEYCFGGERIVIKLTENAEIAVKLAGKPQELEVNGKRTIPYLWEDGFATLHLEAGEHTLYFRHLPSIEEKQAQIPCCVAGKDIMDFNLSCYYYPNGDNVAFGKFPDRGVYDVVLYYQDMSAEPSNIEFMIGPKQYVASEKLSGSDEWQKLEYNKVWLPAESNITIKAIGNGLGQNFTRLGKLVFKFNREAYDFPIKLDFEGEQPGTLPEGWTWIVRSGEGTSVVDDVNSHSGKHSLKLMGKGQDDRVRVGTNPIRGFHPNIGKQYKVKVWCRSEQIDNGSWIKVEFINKGRNKVLGNFFLYPKAGSHDWYLLEGITNPVPEDTAEFWLNIDLPGAGALWIDDFEVLPVE